MEELLVDWLGEVLEGSKYMLTLEFHCAVTKYTLLVYQECQK